MSNERDNSLEDLDHRLAQLPADIAPPEQLWASIETAIADDEHGSELTRLARDIEPAQDLWPGIAARIQDDTGTSVNDKTGSWQSASLLVACLAAVAVATVLFPRLPPEDTFALIGGLNASANAQSVATELLLTATGDSVAAEAQNTFLNHIEIVREQREQIEASMQRYPNDSGLHALWQHTYETELALIDEAGRVLTNI